MTNSDWDLDRDGFRILPRAVSADMIERLLSVFDAAFADDPQSVRARSSRGHVYAARNLIESIPEVTAVWQSDPMRRLLREVLGDRFGLVRALFFDKPPERTWNLPWHKDTSISVKDNLIVSPSFSKPTIKAGVPHVIASDDLLRQMLTLRIHLDEVTDENGPLRVIPRSHLASDSDGIGVDGAVTIHASPGDVLAMRPLISHASGVSLEGTLRRRRILHLEFAATELLPDGYQWHDFVKPPRIG
jgi:ectoine hydroxylase-related dioxygenase (phytanoyl-CoA dioxygenase family)